MGLFERLLGKGRNEPITLEEEGRQLAAPRDADEVERVLTALTSLRHLHPLTPVAAKLVQLGALPRLADLLKSGELHDNARESLVRALLDVACSVSNPDLLFLALEHSSQDDLALHSREASRVLSGCPEDRLIEALHASTSYWPIHIICDALRVRGTQKALEALALEPKSWSPDLLSTSTSNCIAVAAQGIVPRLNDDVLLRLGNSAGPWQTLATEELDRRKKQRDATATVSGLLEQLGSNDRKLEAMAALASIGAAGGGRKALAGDAREQVVAALRQILERERDFDLRKAAYDALKAVGEPVSAADL